MSNQNHILYIKRIILNDVW